MTDAQVEAMVQVSDDNPFKTASETALENNVSHQTVLRRLAENGINAHKPAMKPRLSQQNKDARMRWAVKHRRLNLDQWSKVLFTDESSFSVGQKDGRFYCFRRKFARYDEKNILEQKNRGYGCISVWGGIVGDQKLPLVRIDGRLNAEQYIENILTPHVLPFLQRERQNGRLITLQEDNAPPHAAIITQRFLTDHDVNVLDWPAYTPDMNCIENLWSYLTKALKKRKPDPENADELFQVLSDAWNAIPRTVVHAHTSSMRRRVDCLWRVQGSHTKY